jgi:hypothetical protein
MQLTIGDLAGRPIEKLHGVFEGLTSMVVRDFAECAFPEYGRNMVK